MTDTTKAAANPNPTVDPKAAAKADPEGVAKIKKLVSLLPADTPDEHVMFGYGGYKVTVGDLKQVR